MAASLVELMHDTEARPSRAARLTPLTTGRDNQSTLILTSDTAAEGSRFSGSSAKARYGSRRALVILRGGLTLTLHPAHALLCNKLPCR